MRFLFLITHYYPHVYGAELFAQKVAEHLVTQGHAVAVVTGRWNPRWKQQETINGVTVHRVASPRIRFLQTLLFILPQYRKAAELHAHHHYDYLHAHIFPSLVTGALLASSAVKIVTIQGGDLADYPEIYGPFAFLFRPLIAWSLRQYTRIHTVSRHLSQAIHTLSGMHSVVVPNGIDVAAIGHKLSATSSLVIAPSRLTDKNNLIETIKAIKIVRAQGFNIQLHIAGTGHLQKDLERLIERENLTSTVKLLGYVPHSQLLKLMKSARAVIRVSLDEGFGIAALEALAVGTPLVASKAGGLADFISKDNSWIPQSGNAADIAASIQELIHNPKKVYAKTTEGIKLTQKSYTWKTVLEKVSREVYKLSV